MWQCARTRADSFALTVGNSTIDVRIREQADGALYVQQGDRVAHVRGTEESPPSASVLCAESGANLAWNFFASVLTKTGNCLLAFEIQLAGVFWKYS